MRLDRLVGLVCCLAGCQNYEFQRVEPFTVGQTTQRTVVASRRLKPNLMLLVDNSASMLLPTEPAHPSCAARCGESSTQPCAPSCPTRAGELKRALGDFLARQGTVGRMGLTVFPQPVEGEPCRASTNIDAPLPAPTRNDEDTDAVLQAAASQLNLALQGLVPKGGTPTGGSLDFVGRSTALLDPDDGREDFVVLLTDGLPNCREANPFNVCDCGESCSAARLSACACTQSSCTGTRCNLGCLDEAGAVENVTNLRSKGIRTIVVGFGADVASASGPAVLNAMAAAGGFARRCPNGTAAECGGACDGATRTCAQGFFSARDGDELTSALASISDAVGPRPCDFQLDARPSDPRYLAVLVDDRSVAQGADTWAYDFNANQVNFRGALCERLKRSTPQEPVRLEFRIVEVL